jgi:hypothetical protein
VEERERGGRGGDKDGATEGDADGGEKEGAREKRNRGEREKGLPKDLCANLENYRDLSVKYKFLINLKP